MKMNSPCINCGADVKVCKECDWYNGVWIPKNQYEAKLKTDIITVLSELQLEIEELNSNHTIPDVWSNQASKEIWNAALKLIEEIIEVRINNLRDK